MFIDLKVKNDYKITQIQFQTQQQTSSMQQHYQIINLHNIIRSQQAKIQQLREQLRIATEREQNRYGQLQQNNKITLDDKEKMIEYLKDQLNKCYNNRALEVSGVSQKYDRQRQRLEREVIAYKKKCIELEGRLKRLENQNQIQLDDLQEKNKKVNEQIRKYQQSRANLTMEITKLNHYYKNSMFEIGKRKQTLLWVDKFTQYLESSEMKQKRTLDDVSNYVKNQINSLRTSLGEMVTQIAKNQSDIHTNKNQVHSEIIKMISKVKQECGCILQENDQFWNTLIKQQKQSEKVQQIKYLQGQINKLNEKHSQQVQQLMALLKNYETQKKTLILGFQQLKSLNQSRESAYRQQIKQLKKTIEQLMEVGAERDKEFQEEIKILANQIENISQRYYENIQFPSRKINQKISQEVQQVKLQLGRMQTNSALKNSIQNLQKMIEAYAIKNVREKSNTPQISEYFLHSSKLMQQLLQYITQQRSNSSLKIYSSRQNTFGHEQQIQFEQYYEEKQIDLREKLNKSNYQVILTKKHLSKLKQYCQNLEKKHALGNSQNIKKSEKSERSERSSLQRQNFAQKIVQLQAQNEALKQKHLISQRIHTQTVQSLRRRLVVKSTSQSLTNTNQLIKSTIAKIGQINNKLEKYFKSQDQFQYEIKQNVKILKSLIFKPMQSFEILIKQISQAGISTTHRNQLNTDRSAISSQRTYPSYFSTSQQFKNYKDILNKKNQNYNSTNKLLSDLIRTVRQTSSKQSKEKNANQKKQQLIVPPKKHELRLKGIQKRIKDIQNLKGKEKQEMLDKIQKLSQKLQKINNKISKSTTLKSTLNKFQVNLDQKIDEIVSKTQIKLDKADLVALKDQVILDLKSKLQQANIQCEGLRKQMTLLYVEKKN